MGDHRTTDFDVARDELFSHIHRCGVLKASAEQQEAWLADTANFLNERHPTLTDAQIAELREIGARFCQPAVPHGKDHSALTVDADTADEDEMVGAA